MYANVLTATLHGLEGVPVNVETDLSPGIPAFLLVGLPGASIREAEERIHRAIVNSGFRFPEKKITVNLSPANLHKEGTHFDLPIALGVLTAGGYLPVEAFRGAAFLGELSLNGKVDPVRGALPLAAGLRKSGVKRIYLPRENAAEVSLLSDLTLIPADTLEELAFDLQNGVEKELQPAPSAGVEEENTPPDFADVRGQEAAKRALEVAAAGKHGILMIGPPGSGKTMLARRLPGILPPMTLEEMLEVTMVHSVAGELEGKSGFVQERPFREPHHTVPLAALTGGGAHPKPGEISLADKGVLFLDEFPEYDRAVLEALREPMESKRIVLTRLADTVTYPADFLLAAACNPCPCGYYGEETGRCTCTASEIRRYRAKLSGPILDRIDLQIVVERVRYEDLTGFVEKAPRTTKEMREAVARAVEIQQKRYNGIKQKRNSELNARQIKAFCVLEEDGHALLEEAFQRLHLSARAYGKILKVARTVADLDGAQRIGAPHVAEAIRYRVLQSER